MAILCQQPVFDVGSIDGPKWKDLAVGSKISRLLISFSGFHLDTFVSAISPITYRALLIKRIGRLFIRTHRALRVLILVLSYYHKEDEILT